MQRRHSEVIFSKIVLQNVHMRGINYYEEQLAYNKYITLKLTKAETWNEQTVGKVEQLATNDGTSPS